MFDRGTTKDEIHNWEIRPPSILQIQNILIVSKAGMWVFGIAVKESKTWVGFKLRS